MTCSSAAVEPTSDSALPIRAKLFGGPDIFGTWPPLSPKIRDFRGPRGLALPIRAKLSGAPRIRHLAYALPKNQRFSGEADRDRWVRGTHPI